MAKRRFRRALIWGAVLLAGAYAALSSGLYWAMSQPPDVFGRIMSHMPTVAMIVLPFEPLWMHARAGALQAGGMAPDFRLPTLDRKETVQLSSYRGSRPVVLVFGSYT